MKALKKIAVVIALVLEIGLLVFNQLVAAGRYPDLNSGLTLLAAYGWLTIGLMVLMGAFGWLFEDPKPQKKRRRRHSQSNKQQPNAAQWWAEQAKRDQFFDSYEKAYRSL